MAMRSPARSTKRLTITDTQNERLCRTDGGGTEDAHCQVSAHLLLHGVCEYGVRTRGGQWATAALLPSRPIGSRVVPALHMDMGILGHLFPGEELWFPFDELELQRGDVGLQHLLAAFTNDLHARDGIGSQNGLPNLFARVSACGGAGKVLAGLSRGRACQV